MAFVHLHLHSEYSFLDGSIKIKDLFKKAKELGQNAVAITEHGNMHALVQKYKLAKAEGIKLIIGMEAYLCDDMTEKSKKRYHFLMLAKDQEGLQNLIKLSSIANIDGFYYKARLDKKTLKKYSKGIIATSACLGGEIQQQIVKGTYEKAKKIAQEYVEIFGKENFYIEMHNHGFEDEDIANEGLKKIAKELDLPIIAAVDAHFLTKEDAKAHEIMLCVQTKKKYSDEKRMKFPGQGYWLMSEDEVKELFPDNPEYLENTQKIADRCNVELDLGNTYFPVFELPEGETHDSMIRKMCDKALEEIYGNDPLYEAAKERMNFELSVIQKMGFSTYFLIVADFIKAAKEFCQVGPGRGSGAGSIVAYLLGITQLEPLSLGLLFERFLNPERVSLPDFDVDFGDRDKVLEYVKDKYGHDKVALIGTYGTMMAKACLKDVARALDVPFDTANDITKYLTEKTIQKALDLKTEAGQLQHKELHEYKKQYPELFEIAQRLEGSVRQPGIHACGVVFGPLPITDYMPVFKKDQHLVTQMDKDEVEERGLVKFDFLGLETLNIIQKVLNLIGKDGKWLEQVPIDDEKVYDMLAKGESTGVFQLESAGMQKTLKLVVASNFDDIIAIVALYRPGPMQYLETYANRKHGKETAKYPHEWAKEILEPTYGIMVYQEQVMQLAQKLANFTMGEADVLRKAIGKKKLDLMMKCEKQFKDGCASHAGMEEKVTNQLWDDIVKFAAYSFNKSHAAAYALISYRTAYLKRYYPVEFYTALISSATNDPEKMVFYVQQAAEEGINIMPPSINKSNRGFSADRGPQGEGIIRFGLSGVKNVGGSAIDEIIENRPYSDYQDFINKVDLSKINKRVLKHLILAGAFDELRHNRAELINGYEHVEKIDPNQGVQKTLFGGVANIYRIPEREDMTIRQKLDAELEVLGFAITAHPLDVYPQSKSSIFDKLTKLMDDREFECFVIVRRVSEIVTKKGDPMAFLDVEDRYGKQTAVIFPRLFAECGIKFEEDMALILSGKFQNNSMIVNDIRDPDRATKIKEKKLKEQQEAQDAAQTSQKKGAMNLLNFC